MTMPSLAIKESDLARSSAPPPTKSGHSVEKVFFTPVTELSGLGFLKRCDPSYTPLRAKYNVARSVFYRASLGNRASEERLVYNLHNQISATVSVAIPDFTPFQKLGEKSTSLSYEENELSNPSIHTLTERNVAELFVANYRHQNDDVHPDNFSLAGIIDLDMCGIENIALKDERITSGLIHGSQACATIFLSRDLDDFPVLATSRIHWPTHRVPLNGNLLKAFKHHENFVALKDSPQFREQMFTAFLKELLMFQEQPLKKRLDARLGENCPIDLDGLAPKDGSENIRKNNLLSLMKKDLFYKKNKQNKWQERTFTDHFMRHMKNEYDSLYVMLTNYPEFNDFLFSNPGAYLTARHFFAEENAKYPPDQQYDLEKMDIYYEKILRDSLRPAIFKLLSKTQTIIDNIQKELDQDSYFSSIFSHKGKASGKSNISLCAYAQNTNPSIEIKNDLENLLSALYIEVETLFDSDLPTEQSNLLFTQKVQQRLDANDEHIKTLSQGKSFNQNAQLNELMDEWRSTLTHLTRQSVPPQSSYAKSPMFRYTRSFSVGAPEASMDDSPDGHVRLPNNIDKIISNSLLSWIEESSFDDLKVCISIAIKDYDPQRQVKTYFWTSETRTPKIVNLLNEEDAKSEAQRKTAVQLIEHILTEKGSGWKTTSFNTILMKVLLQKSIPITRSKLAYVVHSKALKNFERQMNDSCFMFDHISNIKNELLQTLSEKPSTQATSTSPAGSAASSS